MTQKEKVIAQFNEFGYVSRNWALKNYMSRLGAIICDLKREGWNIDGRWVGKDFVYSKKSDLSDKTSDNSPEPLYITKQRADALKLKNSGKVKIL